MRSIIDHFAEATISSAGGAADFETAFPLANAQDPQRLLFAQSTTGGVTIRVDLGQSLLIAACAIINTNLTESDRVHIRGRGSANWLSGPILWEETFPAVPLLTGWGDAPWGAFPWGGNYPLDMQVVSSTWAYWLAETRQSRYVEIQIAASDPFYIGTIVLGSLLTGPNINYDAILRPFTASQVVTSPAGAEFANVRPTRYRLSFAAKADDAAAFGSWLQQMQRVADVRPLVLQALHGVSPRVDAIHTRYGRFADPSIKYSNFNHKTISADFVEAA